MLDETSSFKNFSEDESIPVKKKVQVLEDSEAEERMPLIFVDVNLGPARQEELLFTKETRLTSWPVTSAANMVSIF